jgi:hypothetical protein
VGRVIRHGRTNLLARFAHPARFQRVDNDCIFIVIFACRQLQVVVWVLPLSAACGEHSALLTRDLMYAKDQLQETRVSKVLQISQGEDVYILRS